MALFSQQEELKKEFFDKTLPTQLANLQKLLPANNEGKGFFVGEKVNIPAGNHVPISARIWVQY